MRLGVCAVHTSGGTWRATCVAAAAAASPVSSPGSSLQVGADRPAPLLRVTWRATCVAAAAPVSSPGSSLQVGADRQLHC